MPDPDRYLAAHAARLGKALMDVTAHVRYDNPDDELLPLTRCVCGQAFGSWHLVLQAVHNAEPADYASCDHCGRRLVWTQQITVYELQEPAAQTRKDSQT